VPFDHAFSKAVCMAYLDLAELDRVFADSRLWSVGGRTPVSFHPSDHLGARDAHALDASVRALVARDAGFEPDGPIRLLTQPRHLGIAFNPASFFYCFDRDDSSLDALVVEVTNTPWLERHTYALDLRTAARARHPKAFHVSPFMGMGHEYAWHIAGPGRRLRLSVANHAPERCFEAALGLERVEISARSLRSCFLRHPLANASITAGIYRQALLLWWKGAQFHPHPGRRIQPELQP
jgi:DUF1365 family protein